MSNDPFQASESSGEPTWRHDGVRVVSGDRLDPNTPQTRGPRIELISSVTSLPSVVTIQN